MTTKLNLVVAAVLSISMTACAGFSRIDAETANYVASLSGDAAAGNITEEYRVGPEDVLEVRVWGDDALSKVVTVRPDGMMTLPLVGDVMAAGNTAEVLAHTIEEVLKDYKSAPEVDVTIAEINSYRIYLLGEVQRPGMIQVRNFTTLLQAIALAGGPSRFASNEILVLRRDPQSGGERVLHLDYRRLSSDKAQDRPFNLVLWPGDTVIIK